MLKFIKLGDQKIAYKSIGKGFPLVFIHGFCEDGRMWDDYALRFSDYQVISLDLPGFGKSDLVDELSIKKMSDVVKAVMDKCRVKQCMMIGHSMGGYVIMNFLEHFKSEFDIKGIVMFHSHPYEDTDSKKQQRDNVKAFIDKNGVAIFVQQFLPSLFSGTYSNSNRFMVQKMTYRASQYTKEAVLGNLSAMKARKDQSKTMEQIHCPVLFINGLKDDAIPKDFAQDQAALPTIGEILNLSDVGHVGMFEAPRLTSKTIREFINKWV